MVGMIDPEVTLVSVHIPKTGGMTLLSILQQVYVGHIQLAYEDERDTIVEKPLCYHGHAVLDKNESTINVFRQLNSDDYIVYDKAIRRLQGQ